MHHHNIAVQEQGNDEQANGNKCLLCLKSNTLTIATVTGVILGAVLGILLREFLKGPWTDREIMYISFLGDLFLQMLKSLILPLIVSSLISAIASLDLSLSGKIAARAIAYYLTTTFAAVVLGMILVVTIRPGVGHSGEATNVNGEERNVLTVDTLLDLVRLTLATVAGVILGAVLGILLREFAPGEWTDRQIMYINFVGELFLQMLKCLILPLIVSSLISAITSLDLTLSGKIAARAIVFYLTTCFAAVILGIILVVAIRPGVGYSVIDKGVEKMERNVLTVDTLLDLVKNMFPANLIEACIQQKRTKLEKNGNETDLYKYKITTEVVAGTNILGLVVASAVIGIALAQLGEEAKTLANFFHSLMAVMMRITTWVIWLSPVGIFFLVASKILEMDDLASVMQSLGLYFSTVLVGLLIQGFLVLPLLYFLLTKQNPVRFLTNIGQAIATAFGTASSSATLPVTIKCLEENLGVDPRVARFALPIGATINMDGTALYEAVAAIFIAQVREVDLDIGTLIAISITATAASIGAAGIPQAGLVTMVMVLDTVGLPAEDVTLILAVDWLLDRFRTAINVMGDAFGASIVNHRSQKELQTLEEKRPSNHSTVSTSNPYE